MMVFPIIDFYGYFCMSAVNNMPNKIGFASVDCELE